MDILCKNWGIALTVAALCCEIYERFSGANIFHLFKKMT